MKCPRCQFTCSNLRDICPRCLDDLRPQKKILGIAITAPTASYDELRNGLAQPSNSMWGKLTQIFATETPTPPPERKQGSPPPSPLPALPGGGNEAEELFLSLRREIESAPPQRIFLSPPRQLSQQDHESIEALFSLARLSVTQPELELRLTQSLTPEAQSAPATLKLTAIVAEFEKASARTVPTLASFGKRRASAPESAPPSVRHEPTALPIARPISRRRAWVASCIDLLLPIVIAFVASWYAGLTDRAAWSSLAAPLSVVFIVSIASLSSTIFAALIPLFGFSVGLRLSRCVLVTETLEDPSTFRLALRFLMAPAALTVIPALPLLPRGQSLLDWTSGLVPGEPLEVGNPSNGGSHF